jgi:fibronectin-binding autotransporter adhesin
VIWNTAVNNAGGTIQALGALAHVDLQSAYIEGGILTTTLKGVVQTVDTGSTLDGITSGVLSNKGTVLVNDHTALSLVGVINNTGTIFEDATSVSGATTVRISGQTATLTGAGQFVMSDNANNVVSGNTTAFQLINQGNTISGAGQFGNGGMEFFNQSGVIQGTGTNALVINLGSGNGVNGAGAFINAKGAGGVSLTQGIFTNNGFITANDGSALTFQSGALLTNLFSGALIGGTWRSIATGHGATLTLSSNAAGGGSVVTDAAILQLSGSGSLIQSFDPTSGTIKALEQTLTSVALGGQLQVLANRGYTSSLDLTDSGIVQLGGGTLAVGALTIATGGLLFGLGTVNEAPTNAGKIEAKGGLLTITGNIVGAGALQIDAASTLEVGGAASETATYTGVGTLKLDLPGSFTGPVAGLVLNDVIDLGGVTDVTKTAVVGSTLTVTRSGHPNLTYTVSGTGLAGNHFDFALDGSGGTNLTLVAGPGAAAVVPLGSSGGGSGSGTFTNLGGSDPTWVGGSGNSFNTAANWNPATVPVAGSDAVITLAGAAVVSSVSNTMATLATGTTDSLEIAGAGSVFTVTNGSGIGGLKGTITVDNSDVLVLGGTIVNAGQIKLGSTGNNTDLRIGSAIVNLQGAGAIHLSNNGSNRIFSNSANFQLINETNTIDGAGQLGAASLTFTNKKLVNANQTTALTLNTQGNIVVNTGTMQASSSGGLFIQNTTVNNAGGTIQALVAKSHVDLSGSTIEGGTLKSAAGGVIRTVGGNGGLDGITAGVLNNTGTVVVSDQTVLSLAGTINNTGTIAESQLSNGGSTQIRIANQKVSLTGGGKLTMSNNSLNQIFGNSASNTLDNVNNTISGAGALGASSLTLVNEIAGVINADQAPTLFQSGQLVIGTAAAGTVNNGLLEATNTGGLVILNTTVNNSGDIDTDGTILAAGAGAHVDLNGATIQGGVLATSGGGVIQTVAASGLDGITEGTINNTGTLLVSDLTRLDIAGTINNTGSILVDQESAAGSTGIRLTSQNVTLQGGGKVVMSNNAANSITGAAGSDTLTNVDNTISGAGQIGTSATMFLVNQSKGVINADQTTALIVRTDANIITNAGTMEGTGTGGLVLWNTAVNNAGGTIMAVGAGAHVDLQSEYIEGGLLTTATGGVIRTVDTGSALDGITSGVLSNTGTIQVADNTRLGLVGTINNTGTIQEAAFSKNVVTAIRIIGNTTLQGGGQLVMSNSINNQIFGTNAAFNLVNVDNTISGAGQIGTAATMTLVNQSKGVINANQAASLTLRTDAEIITNAGTMESTGTAPLNGGLVIWNTAVNNKGGTIQAVGAQAHVDLQTATLEGGSLKSSGGGVIQTVDTGSTLDGITAGVLTNSATVVVNDSMMLSLVGAIANSGTIKEDGFGNTGNTRLRLNGPVTLTGAGKVLMSDNAGNQIFSNGLSLLTNQGNLISGAGQFGAGAMEYDNKSGQIRATGTNALVVNLGQGNGVNEAAGIMAGDGAGGMILTSGFFTNTGTMVANNGSSITFQGGAVNVNLAEGDLVGGTWRSVSSGAGSVLTMSGSAAGGGPIVTDAALLLLQGAGSVIQSFDTTSSTLKPLEQTLTTVASGGQLQVLANRGYTSGLNFTDSGIVQLGGGTFQTNSLSVTSGAKFFGFGTVQNSVSNAGLIEVNTGTLTVTGSISGAGTLQADAATTLVLNGASIQAAKVTDNGTVNLGGGTVQATTFTIAAGAKLIGFGSVQNAVANAGLIEANGGVLGVTGSITGAGTLQADSAATLSLTGTSILATKVTDNGTVSLGGGTLKATTFTVAAASKLIGSGTVQNAVANSGLVEANGGTLSVTGAITGAGALQADSGATLALTGAVNSATTVKDNGTVSIGVGDKLTVTGAVDPASTGVFLLNNSSVLDVAVDKGTSNKMSFIGTGRLAVDAIAQFGNNIGTTSYTPLTR